MKENQKKIKEAATEHGLSLWQDAWRRLLKNKMAVISLIILGVMVAACILAPYITTHSYKSIDYNNIKASPYLFDLVVSAKNSVLYHLGLRHSSQPFLFEEKSEKIQNWQEYLNSGKVPPALGHRMAPGSFIKVVEPGKKWLVHDHEFESRYMVLRAGKRLLFYQPQQPYLMSLSEQYLSELKKPELSPALFAQLDNYLTPLAEDAKISPVKEGSSWQIIDKANKERYLITKSQDRLEVYGYRVSPEERYLFGTDELGRDMFARVLYGGRVSLTIAVLCTLISLTIGISYGATAAYFGGKVDNVLMRFVDIMYSLPYMFLVIILMVIFGKHVFILYMAIGAVSWLTMARIVRGQILSLKAKEFIEAARSYGASAETIIFRHLIPNTLGTVVVYTTITIPRVILVESFLSFLGLGVQPPDPSWGSLCSDGAKAIGTASWLIFFPGLALSITLFCMNFLGDGLRDALDPKMK